MRNNITRDQRKVDQFLLWQKCYVDVSCKPKKNASLRVKGKKVLKLKYISEFFLGFWRIAFTLGEETQGNQYGQNKTVLVSLSTWGLNLCFDEKLWTENSNTT